ncbi:MAG: hypothetical protein IPI96_14415 [Saprospiraceae bacterium]|nr:hypothetical protein [Saprospiraceae bacterium]
MRLMKWTNSKWTTFTNIILYEILWTEKGISKQTIEVIKNMKFYSNSLFFISPNQVHQFEEWKPLKGGTILFTEDFFAQPQ